MKKIFVRLMLVVCILSNLNSSTARSMKRKRGVQLGIVAAGIVTGFVQRALNKTSPGSSSDGNSDSASSSYGSEDGFEENISNGGFVDTGTFESDFQTNGPDSLSPVIEGSQSSVYVHDSSSSDPSFSSIDESFTSNNFESNTATDTLADSHTISHSEIGSPSTSLSNVDATGTLSTSFNFEPQPDFNDETFSTQYSDHGLNQGSLDFEKRNQIFETPNVPLDSPQPDLHGSVFSGFETSGIDAPLGEDFSGIADFSLLTDDTLPSSDGESVNAGVGSFFETLFQPTTEATAILPDSDTGTVGSDAPVYDSRFGTAPVEESELVDTQFAPVFLESEILNPKYGIDTESDVLAAEDTPAPIKTERVHFLDTSRIQRARLINVFRNWQPNEHNILFSSFYS